MTNVSDLARAVQQFEDRKPTLRGMPVFFASVRVFADGKVGICVNLESSHRSLLPDNATIEEAQDWLTLGAGYDCKAYIDGDFVFTVEEALRILQGEIMPEWLFSDEDEPE